MTKIRPIVGNWASDDAFFGREAEVEELVHRLRGGANVSLAAPRRIGKTSLLQEVRRRLDGEMTCVFVDLEGAATPEEAIAEIAEQAEAHRALRAKVAGWGRWLLGATSFDLQVVRADLKEALRVDWQARGSRLVAELCTDGPVVLFLDELPVLVASLLAQPAGPSGRSPADLFLSWLRSQTQRHRQQLRVVLTGSIGLAPMVARAGLSTTLNVYEPARLDPWPLATAAAALRGLAEWDGLRLAEGVPERALELLGVGVPYHVQLVHQALAEDARRRRSPVVGVADLERVWRERVLSRPSADLPHWEQRLRKALDPAEYALAVRLLTEAAEREPLAAARALQLAAPLPDPRASVRAVLGTLEHDGYLARDGRGWYFPNRLLRAWWSDQYGPFDEGRT